VIALAALLLAAAPQPSYAIIVGNNASPTLGRRPLQYADDDAMKYEAVFRGLIDPSHVRLLAAPDDDTSRLFPEAVSRAVPPTRGALKKAFDEVAAAVHAANGHARLYFVFAGHGDVDQGKGFLELQDGTFNGDDLEQAFREVAADEAHVILDSCNSFFVLAPRKPGGRHFTTPKDAALQLAERMPNVGVLLSTSAEAEVYEWSELQSGVFSHAVRSGLTGAADVNGDGVVSYAELAAFVDTATRTVPNPNFRPQIFARGPRGDAASPFVALPNDGTLLSARTEQPLRLVLRDAAGIRWFDVHAEANTKMLLRLPAFDVSVERIHGEQRQAYTVASGRSASLETLPRQSDSPRARGATEALRALFASPFGPAAFAQWEKRAEDPATGTGDYIGLAHSDLERMRIILRAPALREERSRRWALALGGSIAAAAIIGGSIELATNRNGSGIAPAFGYAGAAVAGIVGAAALYGVNHAWTEQLELFEDHVKSGNWQAALAGADAFIEERGSVSATHLPPWVIRTIGGFSLGVAAFGIGFSFLPSSMVLPSFVSLLRALSVTLVALGGAMLIVGDTGATEEDDALNIWREERKLSQDPPKVGLGIAPLPGGAALSFSGSF
jgi:hypothetical protein